MVKKKKDWGGLKDCEACLDLCKIITDPGGVNRKNRA